MLNNYSYEEVLRNAGDSQSKQRAGAKQMKQFLHLFLHVLVLPVAYAVFYLFSQSPAAAAFDSRGFSILYWFSVCFFIIVVSQKRRKAIKDAGLRTFYMIAMTAVSFMLALNMTGLL
jgi:hypothetical protein